MDIQSFFSTFEHESWPGPHLKNSTSLPNTRLLSADIRITYYTFVYTTIAHYCEVKMDTKTCQKMCINERQTADISLANGLWFIDCSHKCQKVINAHAYA